MLWLWSLSVVAHKCEIVERHPLRPASFRHPNIIVNESIIYDVAVCVLVVCTGAQLSLNLCKTASNAFSSYRYFHAVINLSLVLSSLSELGSTFCNEVAFDVD